MKIFKKKGCSLKILNFALCTVILGAGLLFTGCFGGGSKTKQVAAIIWSSVEKGESKTKHVAAIIRPSVEELEVERSRVWKYIENEAKKIKAEIKDESKYRSIGKIEGVYNTRNLLTVGEVIIFYDEIEEVLSMRKDLRLVDRNRIQEVIKEHEFAFSSWSDNKKKAEIGKALNCDTLIFLESDTIFPMEENNGSHLIQTVRVEFLDVNTFTKKVVVAKKGRSYDGFFDKWHKSKKALKNVDLD